MVVLQLAYYKIRLVVFPLAAFCALPHGLQGLNLEIKVDIQLCLTMTRMKRASGKDRERRFPDRIDWIHAWIYTCSEWQTSLTWC